MRYRVEIVPQVLRTIETWDLHPDLKRDLLEELRDSLAVSPVQELGHRVVAPVRCIVVTFPMYDSQRAEMLRFTFWVNDTLRPQTRIVLDGAMTRPKRDGTEG